jgi:hypothetical protein
MNTNITYAVQNFIFRTKRFSEYLKWPPPPPPNTHSTNRNTY